MKVDILHRLHRLGLLVVPLAGCGSDDVTGTTFFTASAGEEVGSESSESAGSEGESSMGESDASSSSESETDSDTSSTTTSSTSETDTTTDTGECADGQSQPCYEGFPAESQNLGVCKPGLQTCENGMWGACVGQVTPGLESCNNLDENCNGVIDDGNPGGGGACFTGQPGICQNGTQTCMAGDYVCVQTMQPSFEMCFNGLDDDCNGLTDEFCGCPYVYAYDGARWHYESSVGGASLLGRPRHLVPGRGKRVRFDPLWMRLDAARVLDDRSVRVELLAAEDEIVYFDHAELLAVHHLPDHELVSSSAMQWSTLDQIDPRRFWAFPQAACRVPERASWCGELDVTAALRELDGTPAAYALARANTYELDLGEVGDAKRAWLLLDGWKFKLERHLAPELRGHKPRLDIKQADGSWLPVQTLAAPRGDRKLLAISLAEHAWPTGRYELRISTGTHEGGRAMWFLDRVRLVEATPAPIAQTRIALAHAELSFRGAPTLLGGRDDRPRLSLNDGGGRLGGDTYGAFTRYGEITPLLRSPDDRVRPAALRSPHAAPARARPAAWLRRGLVVVAAAPLAAPTAAHRDRRGLHGRVGSRRVRATPLGYDVARAAARATDLRTPPRGAAADVRAWVGLISRSCARRWLSSSTTTTAAGDCWRCSRRPRPASTRSRNRPFRSGRPATARGTRR